MRVIDFFDRAAGQWSERLCLIDGKRSLTYAQTRDATIQLAAALREHCQGPKPKIAILSPNCADALIGLLAIWRMGAVWIPANGRTPAHEIAAFLTLCDCDLLLFHPDLKDVAEDVGSETGIGRASFSDLACHSVSADARIAEKDNFDREELCSIFGTGGTTGLPKAAMWSHRTWETLIANFHAGIHHEGPPVHLVAAPLTHAAGVVSIPLLAIGATTVIIDRAEPKLVMSAIEKYAVTTLFLPPTAIYSMLAHPDLRQHDFSSLQNLIYAAAPMSTEKLKHAMDVFGPVMVQTFGQAEAPMVCTIFGKHEHLEAMNSGNQERLGSCGRPGLMTEIAILSDDGDVLAAGETGEIAVRGDLLMTGYYNNREATASCRSNGWQRTGDVGRLDKDGFIYITDRQRDMIITGGFNVFPSEVEQVIWSHDAVQDCAVIGCPDEKWGEAVTAIVELKPGKLCDEEELIALCKDRLDSVRAPKRAEFWKELPRSAVGKVLKKEIRAHFWKNADRKI